MKVPNTRGFQMQTLTPQQSAVWGAIRPLAQIHFPVLELIHLLEQTAEECLKPQHGVNGSCRLALKEAPDGVQAVFWVLRHNDYDTGRANFEVQVRYFLDGEEYVHHSKEDVCTVGKLVHYVEQERFIRVYEGDELNWWSESIVEVHHAPTLKFPPATRTPLLFDQCQALAHQVSRWWLGNVPFVVDRMREKKKAPLDPEQVKAIEQLFSTSLLWLAQNETAHEVMRRRAMGELDLPVPAIVEESEEQLRIWRRELGRKNRLATRGQFALHKLLKPKFRQIETRTLERPISISNMIGTHTRWVREVAKHIHAFNS